MSNISATSQQRQDAIQPGNQQQPKTPADQQQQQQQQPNNQQQQQQTQDKDKNQLFPHEDLWNTKPPEPTSPPAGTQQQQQQQAAGKTSEELWQQHLDSLSFAHEIPAEVKEKVQAGDFASLTDYFDTFGRNIYQSALLNSSKAFGSALDKKTKEIERNILSKIDALRSEDSLLEDVDFAGDPNIRPIAKAIKAQLLKLGNNDEEANELTKKFFSTIVQKIAPSIDLTVAPKLKPGDAGFNQNLGPQQGDDINWLEMLGITPKP